MSVANRRFDPEITRAGEQHLRSFVAANPDVTLAVLTSADGFEFASYPPDRPMSARIAAMSSSMQALSEALTREAGLDEQRSLIVEAGSGTVLILGLASTPPLSLAIVARRGELLGKLLWASRNLGKQLESSLSK